MLKAVELFSNFLHQKGIFMDDELKEVESAIEEFSVPLRGIYEKRAWKYKFLEGWGGELFYGYRSEITFSVSFNPLP